MNSKRFFKLLGLCAGLSLAVGAGVAAVGSNAKAAETKAADSGLNASNGVFIIDFYDSNKLSSTSGSNLTNTNYSSFVKVADGLTKTDVVTSVSVTGTVQYGKNGGLTAGTGSNTSADSHFVTFNIGSDYAVNKCTVYATKYEDGRWKLNGSLADSGSLGSKGTAFSSVTNPLVWNNLSGVTQLTFKRENTSGGNTKRLTIYTIVCEYTSDSTDPDEESTSIDLEVGKSTLTTLSDSTTITATVKDSENNEITDASVTFDVSPKTGIVSLSTNGNVATVSAVGDGVATISASYAGVAGTYTSCSNQTVITVDTPEAFPNGTPTAADYESNCKVIVDSTSFDGYKMGSNGNGGSTTVKIPANSIAMSFRAACWKEKSSVLNVTGVNNITPSGAGSYTPASNTGISNNTPFTLSGLAKPYLHVINFDKTVAETEITFESVSERVVIWDIKAYVDDTKYTVSFSANNDQYLGSVPSAITQADAGASITLPAALSLEGYDWLGWNTNSGGGQSTRIAAGASYVPTNDHTLYGEWKLKSYSVIDSISNGRLSSTTSINHGDSLSITILPDDHYTYPETILSVTMGNAAYADYTYDNSNGSFSIGKVTGDIEIEAKCVATVDTYAVSYDSNGGSLVDGEEVVEGGHPTFPTPTLSGYVFKGWQVNGEGDLYTSENASDYTVSGIVNFVAKWAELFTVSFDSNGGSASPENISVEDGNSFVFPSAGTKLHHSFDGWTSNGSQPYYAASATSPAVKADITYTAHWNEDAKYTVTYVAGTNCSGTSAVNNVYAGYYTLPDIDDLDGLNYDSDKYRFLEYVINDTPMMPGDELNVSGNVQVTVNFEAKPVETNVLYTFSEHYNANTALDETHIEIDSNITIQFNKRDGGTATQYYTNGSSVRWYGGGTLEITGSNDVTITSIIINYSQTANSISSNVGSYSLSGSTGTWNGSASSVLFTQSGTTGHCRITSIDVVYSGAVATTSYTITYMKNAEDATGSMNPTFSANPAVAACAFTYEGYSFARWNTQADGEGDDYEVGTVVTEDITLYAIWQEYIEPIGGNVTMTGVTSASSGSVNGHDAIKCGTGSNAGSMTITLTKANITKIKVYIAGWNNDTNKTVNISINNDATISGSELNDGSITLTQDSKISGSDTAFDLNGEETDYKFEFNISENAPAGTVITLTAAIASKCRFVVWGATDLFAETFASEFMSGFTCDDSGETAPSFKDGYSWSYLEGVYNGLDAEEQGRLQNANALENGSQIEQAMARYDFIVGKYNPSNSLSSAWKNFIGRSVVAIGGSKGILTLSFGGSDNTYLIVITLSLFAAAAICGSFFLRSRKEQ